MPRGLIRASLVALMACVPLAAGAADYARTLGYEKTVAALAAMVEAGKPLADLRAAAVPLGLDPASRVAEALVLPTLSTPKVSVVAIDLILSQLALQSGANYHVALRQAQAKPQILLVESGVTSLDQLYEAMTAAGLAGVLDKTPAGYVAHMPIAVWTGASLALRPGETLELDRESGAFLVVAGTLFSKDAIIRGSGKPDPRLAEFNPFIVVALSGSAQVEGTLFADLGFGIFPPLTGLTVIGGGLYRQLASSSFRSSRFDNAGTLALIGGDGASIADNVFLNGKGASILMTGDANATLSGNVILGNKGAHGIKITAGAHDIAVAHNLIIGAGLNGIFADSGSAGLALDGNLVSGSGRSGVSVASADCVALGGNLLLQNVHSGLAIRDSAGLAVRDNRFIDNGTAGISVTHQPGYGRVLIAGNQLDGNKVGIKGSTTARLDFAANDFTAQAPRLLDGELVQFTAKFLDFGGVNAAPTTIEGLNLKAPAKLTPSGALRPTSCSFPEDV